MCCCSRSRFPSPCAGAQACSMSEDVIPVDCESVFLLVKMATSCFSLRLVSPCPRSCWAGAPHWLLRYEVVFKQSVGDEKASSGGQRCNLVRESLWRIVQDRPLARSATGDVRAIICADPPPAPQPSRPYRGLPSHCTTTTAIRTVPSFFMNRDLT